MSDVLKQNNREVVFGPAVIAALDVLDGQNIDVVRGPKAFAVMAIQPDFVMTGEAWPHIDPSWEGMRFVTLTLQGNGYSFGSVSAPEEVQASFGTIIEINPIKLHWLRPDVITSHDSHWVGLQWTVKNELLAEFRLALATKLKIWNNPDFELNFNGPI